MKGQELNILFKDDLAFLTEEIALDFEQVQISDFPIKLKAPAFWTVRVLDYIENECTIIVEVLSYDVGETKFSNSQIKLAETLITIEKVKFKSIETRGLLQSFSINTSKPLPNSNSNNPIKILQQKSIEDSKDTSTELQLKIQREPKKETYYESFSIPIKHVSFLSGKVAFEKKIQHFKKQIEFEIINDNIIEEYDAIKNYFSSVLKTKKIQVAISIITLDGRIISQNAKSEEIEKIDKTLIEEVKFAFVKSIRKKDLLGDKQLFTMDEYLETMATENLNGNKIFKTENDFFENLLEKSTTKHYKHLRYLSSKHQAHIQKLRFVHKPFSFVFLLSSIEKFHIVWETLDTEEATYIWTVSANVEDLKKVMTNTDKIINEIIRDGKNEYINRREDTFKRVIHNYADLQNGFKTWKEDIEKVIS
ncbi:MAG: hypothetical protein HYU71_06330 [Bacteroidetes bacterium]|nr:hypothetical protein [Bacteroidota bacterium]